MSSKGAPKKNAKAFFLVFSPEGETPPVRVIATHREALGIAWLMAGYHPGQDFYVMRSASRPCKVETAPSDALATPEQTASNKMGEGL